MPRLLRFAAVGLTGFVFDVAVLAALHSGLGVDPLLARFGSMASAVLVTWRLNRAHTFGSTNADQLAEGLRYVGVVGVSLSVNYAVYAFFLIAEPGWPPALGVAAGAGVAMTVSYLGYSLFVFAPAGAPAGANVLPATLWPPSSEHSR